MPLKDLVVRDTMARAPPKHGDQWRINFSRLFANYSTFSQWFVFIEDHPLNCRQRQWTPLVIVKDQYSHLVYPNVCIK